MTDNAHLLSDIVQAARDGAEFYDAAAGEVSNPQLRDTFTGISDCLEDSASCATAPAS